MLAQLARKLPNSQIAGSKVVAPFGDAVSFVYNEIGDWKSTACQSYLIPERFNLETLWRDEDEPPSAIGHQVRFSITIFGILI
jgi:hypothetical protein